MQPDVVIVGAGAAGVGAGLALQARGVPFVILEGAGRIGGRTFTDEASLPALWDHGAAWFHSADLNPLRAEADRLGHPYEKTEGFGLTPIWQAGCWLGPEETEAGNAAQEAGIAAIYAAAAAGRESALRAVLPGGGPWAAVMDNMLRLMSSGEPEAVSVRAYAEYADSEVNRLVTGGYGRLIARLAEGLPVRLGQPVTKITQLARGVRVEGPGGVIEARAAIVTASTNALNGGGIRFDSRPVAGLLELMQDVPCGYYEKVALAVDGVPAELGEARFFWADPGAGERSLGVQVRPGPVPLLIAHVGGDEAREMVGPALEDHVRRRLAAVFGSGFAARVKGAAVTGWRANPFVRGAYSYVRAGCWPRRAQMIAAETGDIRFAGEAFSANWHSTAHGAFLSGRAVAESLMGQPS